MKFFSIDENNKQIKSQEKFRMPQAKKNIKLQMWVTFEH